VDSAPGRSLASIERHDLLRLAELAADGETGLFARHPAGAGRYTGRLLCRALCQGAALHYLDRSNGVKDFDVWSFYAERGDGPFRTGGGAQPTTARRSSGDTRQTRRRTQAAAWTCSDGRFRPPSSTTR